jgi:hypothetical protein
MKKLLLFLTGVIISLSLIACDGQKAAEEKVEEAAPAVEETVVDTTVQAEEAATETPAEEVPAEK